MAELMLNKYEHMKGSTTFILRGVVGSQAYGFAHPDSDVDRLGIFALPKEEFLKMGNGPQMTLHFKDDRGDVTMHEARKFCELAMSCNPSVLELLWLDQYEVQTTTGWHLVQLRQYFLSRDKVRNSYLGYAAGQIRRMQGRPNVRGEERRARVAKHARHIFRLLHQGLELYVTGDLPVRLNDPPSFVALGNQVADGDYNLALEALHDTERKFAECESALPERSDPNPINDWLVDLRHTKWLD